MKILKVKSSLSEKALRKIIKYQSDTRALKGWLIIYNVQLYKGKRAEEIAQMPGVCRSMVYRVINLYNEYGKNWFSRYYSNNRGGRRESRCLLSLENEKLLMKSLEDAALSGNVLTFRSVKENVERIVGKTVSDDYIWDLFHRHGWKKKVPRQHHPKADKAAQEEYKKNFGKTWMPNH
jgi:transposase